MQEFRAAGIKYVVCNVVLPSQADRAPDPYPFGLVRKESRGCLATRAAGH